MSISDDQFERLVGMLADNRADITNVKNDIILRLDELKRDQALGFKMLSERMAALEEDVTRVQSALRAQEKVLGEHTQSLDGVTQLCKSGWDLTESLQRHIHGEADERAEGTSDEGKHS